MSTRRCGWVSGGSELDTAYHDHEWGVPVRDSRRLFECLTLEGAQAGLSWSTILKKREGYRRAFADFDVEKIARFNARSVERLMNDAGIVRNRLKIDSTIANARAFIEMAERGLEFADHVWSFVDGEPVQNRWRRLQQLPASTPRSVALSRDLKQQGFRFVGPTICYAFMQAVGMVNDHQVDCFRHAEIRQLAARRT